VCLGQLLLSLFVLIFLTTLPLKGQHTLYESKYGLLTMAGADCLPAWSISIDIKFMLFSENLS